MQPIQRNVPPPPAPFRSDEGFDEELEIEVDLELRPLHPQLDELPASGLREAILRFLDEEF